MFCLFKKLKAVRGAIVSCNTPSQIKEDTFLLYMSIIQQNRIEERDIVSVQFSLTSDLTAFNPCTALREKGLLQHIALFTSLEPSIDGSVDGVIRILVLYYGKKEPVYVYMNGAEVLRKI